MQKSIILAGREVTYDLQRKNVKNINLRIRPDGSMHLSANDFVSESTIREFLISNTEAILKALDRFSKNAQPAPRPVQYNNDEIITFLGSKKTLRLLQGDKNTVAVDEAFITLTVTDTEDCELKVKTLDAWRKENCETVVKQLVDQVYPRFQQFGIPYPALRFRKMKSMWGNCRPKTAVLTFNTLLIHYPLECIEYVVYHEFTHFLHPDHSKNFYNELEKHIPDWRSRKGMLKK